MTKNHYIFEPSVKNYAWGKKKHQSLIAEFIDHSLIDSTTPLAELWFGTHSNGPGKIADGTSLLDILPEPLPVLAKILSIDSPLSIQVHPNEQQAEILHKKDPKNYPDPLAKYEMAIALSEVTLLHGFYPAKKLHDIFIALPELGKHTTSETWENLLLNPDSEILLQAFIADFVRSPETLRKETLATIQNNTSVHTLLFQKLAQNYLLNDFGLLFTILLKEKVLAPGEAIWTIPGTLHAYLSGEMIEVMTPSDNTVRAGLTEKWIDLQTFIDITRYSSAEKGLTISEIPFGKQYIPDGKKFIVEIFSGSRALKDAKRQMLFGLSELGFMGNLIPQGNGLLMLEEAEEEIYSEKKCVRIIF
jgi:mannose-6-phosphate isomerase